MKSNFVLTSESVTQGHPDKHGSVRCSTGVVHWTARLRT